MSTHFLCLILVSYFAKNMDSMYSFEPPHGGKLAINTALTYWNGADLSKSVRYCLIAMPFLFTLNFSMQK